MVLQIVKTGTRRPSIRLGLTERYGWAHDLLKKKKKLFLVRYRFDSNGKLFVECFIKT